MQINSDIPDICPLCESKLSNWDIAKPTFLPNKIKCRSCNRFLKIAYPKKVKFIFMIVSMPLGMFIAHLSLLAAGVFFKEYSNNYFIFGLIMALIVSVIIVIISGFIEAKVARGKFPIKIY